MPLAKQASWDAVKDFSQAVAQHMASTLPKLFSAKMGMQNRKGKIFIDYLRNNRGSSTVAAFSLRARPGLGASVPLAWDELDERYERRSMAYRQRARAARCVEGRSVGRL